MLTYEYQCNNCGVRFERQQNMKDEPVKKCPECQGEVQRLISGGTGFILKSLDVGQTSRSKSCSLEDTGKTCCGASQRCGKSACGDNG
jgi:putative FmdB family regulatory protein